MALIEFKDYPNTDTSINSENLNDNFTELNNICDNLQTGWIPANETWTYASVDNPTGVIKISGDKTTKYSLGMRIKFTNGGNTIYGIITKISYTSPNTTLTFLHEINPSNNLALHLMTNSAITNNYYSNMKAPFGFPMHPEKWSLTLTSTSNLLKDFPEQNTWYNLGSFNIQIPIGFWDVDYSLYQRGYRGASGLCKTQTSLSTSTSSGNTDLSTFVYGNPMNDIGLSVYAKQRINLSSPTTYYLITRTDVTGMGDIGYDGSRQRIKVRAVCVYL